MVFGNQKAISYQLVSQKAVKNNGDMIKGNESDVRNIDFELQATRCNKFLFYIVLNPKELFMSLQPDVRN